MAANYQQQLKEEQEKTRFLLDIINAIPEPIMAKNWHGKFIFSNKALADFYNTTPQNLIGKDDSHFNCNKEQTEFFTESVQAIIKSKKPQVVYENVTDIKTGKINNFLSLKTPFVNSKGEDNVVIIANNITDITILKDKAEKNEKRLAGVLEVSHEGMWDWNTETNDVFHNKRWEKITGVVDLENSFEEFQRCIFAGDKEKVNEAIEKLVTENVPYSIEYRMIRPSDNKQIWIWDRGIILEHNEQGRPLWVVGIIQDITRRKLVEEKIKLAASVFTHARESIMITDATGIIVDVNDTFSSTTGFSREEAIGHYPSELQPGRQAKQNYADMWQVLLKDGYWSGEMWKRRKNGEVYAEIKTVSAVRDEQGVTTHYVSLGNDITLIKEHQDQLERIAHYDILTNLPNRVLLSDRLSQTMLHCNRHEESLAVVFLDLDGFKAVNDTYGHKMGDEVLIAISARMQKALREGDSLARLGGDEFVAVLTDLTLSTAADDCEPVLTRLLRAVSEPIIIGEIVLNVSASIGVTLYPQDNVNADQLMRHADQAMYVAKESGKNRYHLFDTAQDVAVKVQRESLEAVRSALENNQFVLYYQPKVNMKTGTVVGVEALIRWQHPKRGLLSPIEFLSVIENTSMMIELGEWVIDTALAQIGEWQAMGLQQPFNTSVNIAGIQLQQSDFTQRLTALLAEHKNVDPSYLELEVLETSALDDVHHVSAIMCACMALGVKFALDDFGTGYSSLTYLRRLPAKIIKIDQTFVRDMLVDTDDLAIVEGVIALAKSFKRDVIAEGVETIEHGTALLQLGCDLAQGYGIARPMPGADIPTWCENWKPDICWQS
jgi:diguanylate cyclase (GGDEF)-like protein/PAS domain S-box-containing protein